MNEREINLIKRAFSMFYNAIGDVCELDSNALAQDLKNEFFDVCSKVSELIDSDVTP